MPSILANCQSWHVRLTRPGHVGTERLSGAISSGFRRFFRSKPVKSKSARLTIFLDVDRVAPKRQAESGRARPLGGSTPHAGQPVQVNRSCGPVARWPSARASDGSGCLTISCRWQVNGKLRIECQLVRGKLPLVSNLFHDVPWSVRKCKKKVEGTFHNVTLGNFTLTPVKGRRLPLFPKADHYL